MNVKREALNPMPSVFVTLHNNTIDLSGQNLDLEKDMNAIEQIENYLKTNTHVGHLKNGQAQMVNMTPRLQELLVENNKKFKRYASERVLCLLNSRINDDKMSLNQELNLGQNEKWKVIYQLEQENGYYGVLFENERKQQLVLVHRAVHLANINSIFFDLKTVFLRIMDAKSTNLASCIQSTDHAVKQAQNKHFNLTISGYSSGALLSEFSVYHSTIKMNYFDLQCVNFDSPGSLHLFKELDINKIDQFSHLITSYFSTMSLFNSVDEHIAARKYAFRKEDDLLALSLENHLNDYVLRNTLTYWYFLAIKSQSFDFFLKVFNARADSPSTPLSTQMYEVKKWSLIEFDDMRNLTKNRNLFLSKIEKLFDEMGNAERRTKNFYRYLIEHAYCFNDIDYVINKIFKRFNKSIQLLSETDTQANLRKEQLNSCFVVDRHLQILAKLTDCVLKKSLNDQLILKQVKWLKQAYQINEKEHMIQSDTLHVSQLRDLVYRLCSISPEFLKTLESNRFLLLNVKELVDVDRQLPFYQQVNEAVFDQLEKFLSSSQPFAVLTGPCGVGKTRFAIEFAHAQMNKNQKLVVRRFVADTMDTIRFYYLKLAEDFGLSHMNILSTSLLMKRLEREIECNRRDLDFLFIFDNVTEFKNVRQVVQSALPNVKFILIATDKKVFTAEQTSQINDAVPFVQLNKFDLTTAWQYLKRHLDLNTLSENEMEEILTLLPQEQQQQQQAEAGFSPLNLKRLCLFINFNHSKELDWYKAQLKSNDITKVIIDDVSANFPLVWQMLEYTAFLNAHFISIELLACLLDKDEHFVVHLSNTAKSYGLLDLSRIEFKNGSQPVFGVCLDTKTQDDMYKFIQKNHKPIGIESNNLVDIFNVLISKLKENFKRNFAGLKEAAKSNNAMDYARYLTHTQMAFVHTINLLYEEKWCIELVARSEKEIKMIEYHAELLKLLADFACEYNFNYANILAFLHELEQELGGTCIKSRSLLMRFYAHMRYLYFTFLRRHDNALDCWLKQTLCHKATSNVPSATSTTNEIALFYWNKIVNKNDVNESTWQELREYVISSLALHKYADVRLLINKLKPSKEVELIMLNTNVFFYEYFRCNSKVIKFLKAELDALQSKSNKDELSVKMNFSCMKKLATAHLKLTDEKRSAELYERCHDALAHLTINEEIDLNQAKADAYSSLGQYAQSLQFTFNAFFSQLKCFTSSATQLTQCTKLDDFVNILLKSNDIIFQPIFLTSFACIQRNLYDLRLFALSLQLLEHIYELNQSLYDDTCHVDLLANLNDLIVHKYLVQQDNKHSLKHLETALQMVYGFDSIDCFKPNAAILSKHVFNLALCTVIVKNECQKGLELALKSVDMLKKLFEPTNTDHLLVSFRLNDLALYYLLIENYFEALNVLKRAYSMLRTVCTNEEIREDEYENLAKCLNNIGVTYFLIGNKSDSVSSLTKSHELLNKIFVGNHLLKLNVLINLAVVEFEMGKAVQSHLSSTKQMLENLNLKMNSEFGSFESSFPERFEKLVIEHNLSLTVNKPRTIDEMFSKEAKVNFYLNVSNKDLKAKGQLVKFFTLD